MQSLLFQFLQVTEAAALAVDSFVGRGNKEAADDAATTAMRKALNHIDMDASIVIGEGEIDHAPMLYIGERIGTKNGQALDIAVDPVEGTTPASKGQQNSMAVLAVAPEGQLLHAPDMYMKKIVVGPNAKGKIDINAPIEENLAILAMATGKEVHQLRVLVQDRPRHDELVTRIRQTGAKVELFMDGDVIYTLASCMEDLPVDMLVGIGGAPEGVIGAAAVHALGGDMQAQLMPRDEVEFNRCKEMGLVHPNKVLRLEELVGTGDCLFVATGITDSLILQGLEKSVDEEQSTTHSMLINGTAKKVHYIDTVHQMEK